MTTGWAAKEIHDGRRRKTSPTMTPATMAPISSGPPPTMPVAISEFEKQRRALCSGHQSQATNIGDGDPGREPDQQRTRHGLRHVGDLILSIAIRQHREEHRQQTGHGDEQP